MHSNSIFNRSHLCRFFNILTRCEAIKKLGSTGQYIADTAITTTRKNRNDDSYANQICWHLSQQLKGGVQWSGFANSYDQTKKAIALAKTVTGIATVKNDIRINP